MNLGIIIDRDYIYSPGDYIYNPAYLCQSANQYINPYFPRVLFKSRRQLLKMLFCSWQVSSLDKTLKRTKKNDLIMF